MNLDKKPIYAALSTLVIFASGCSAQTTAKKAVPVPNNVAYYPNQSVVSNDMTGTANNLSVTSSTAAVVSSPSSTTSAAQPATTNFRTYIDSSISDCDKLFVAAGKRDWAKCKTLKTTLRTSVKNAGLLNNSNTMTKSTARDQLRRLLTSLDKAVASRSRARTQSAANRIEKLIYDMGNTIKSGSVSEVNIIKYYSRDICLSNNLKTAKNSDAALARSWNGIRTTSLGRKIKAKVSAIGYYLKKNDLSGAKKASTSLYGDALLGGNNSIV